MVQGPERSLVTLVLGGVRSGKSRYGQRLAEERAAAGGVVFLATAESRADDHEMRGKIARHREDRPEGWRTIEEPLELGAVIRAEGGRCGALVVDCLTMFAANLLDRDPGLGERAERTTEALYEALAERSERTCQGGLGTRVILVSNEVGSGVVPAFALGRQFRDLLGEMNQRVAAIADEVVLMVAGLPLPLKSRGVEGGR